MKRPLIVALALLFFCSCNKDSNELHKQNDNHKIEQRSLNLSAYQFNLPEDKFYDPQPVPEKLLIHIYNSLHNLENWNTLKSAIEAHGELRWNWAELDVQSDEFYFGYIPICSGSNITGLVRYNHFDDHYHFNIVTLCDLFIETDGFSNTDVDHFYIPFVTKLMDYQILSTDGDIYAINEWMKDFKLTIPQDQLTPRDVSLTVEWKLTTYEVWTIGDNAGGYINESEAISVDTWETEINIPCDNGGPPAPPPPFDFDVPPPPNPGGPSNGNPGSTPPEDGDEDKETERKKDIEIKDEDCKNDHMNSDAVRFVQNELKNYEFPCEQLDAQALIDQILEELCAEADTPGGLDLEGLVGSITRDKVEAEIDKNDWINEDTSFRNCKTYKCVSDYLNANNLIHYCEDLDPLFDSELYGVTYTTHNVGADGETKISNLENGEITISFHTGDCNPEDTDLLKVAETLYHEGQHAAFFMELMNGGLDSTNEEAVREAWAQFVSENYNIPYNSQHQVMRDQYMEKAAEFLWNLNGQNLTKEHYMYYVYVGLDWFNFPQSDIDRWKDMHKELNGISPYTTDHNTFSCN